MVRNRVQAECEFIAAHTQAQVPVVSFLTPSLFVLYYKLRLFKRALVDPSLLHGVAEIALYMPYFWT